MEITVKLPVEGVYNALGRARTWLAGAMKRGGDSVLNSVFDAANNKALFYDQGYDLSKVENQLKLYTLSADVYIAVTKIATSGAGVEMEVYTVKGEDKTPVVNHPIEQLLRRPNARQSGFALMFATMGFLQLTGNAYWYLASTSGGPPDQIYTLRPDRMVIKPGKTADKPIDGYVYTVNDVKIPIDPDSVIHFRRFHPLNDYYGLSPIEAASLEINSDMAMARWNNNYFGKDMGIPAGVVNIKNAVNDGDYERIQTEWRRSYGGTQRKTAFIRGADVTYEAIGLAHRDTDFLLGRQFNKEVVMLVWGVPPGMLDKNATEANALAAIETFTRDTLYPAMLEIGDVLTNSLAPFYGDNLVVEPHDIRIKDEKAEQQRLLAYRSFDTINDVRQMQGDDPLTLMVDFNGEQINLYDQPPDMAAGILAAQTKAASVPQTTPNATVPDETDATKEGGFSSLAQQRAFFGLLNSGGLSNQGGSDNPAMTPRQRVSGTVSQGEEMGTGGGAANEQPKKPRRSSSDAFDDPTVSNQMLHDSLVRVVPPGKSKAHQQHFVLDRMSTLAFERQSTIHVALGDMQNQLASRIRTYGDTARPLTDKQMSYAMSMMRPGYGGIASKSYGLLPATLTELRQFETFTAKHTTKSRRAFVWDVTPLAYQVLALSYADTDPALLATLTHRTAYKATQPHERISISGKRDPLAHEKTALTEKLRKQVLSHLSQIKADLDARGENIPDADYWTRQSDDLKATLQPTITDGIASFATALALLVNMQHGTDVSSDESTAQQAGDEWANDIPGKIIDTTQTGIQAIYDRWQVTPDATADDLQQAVNDSYWLSDDRAGVIGDTESNRMGSSATKITAQSMAKALGVPWQNDDVAGPPLHGSCFCWDTPIAVQDADGNYVGTDRVWHTRNSPQVCEDCRPLNGLTFSEIAQMGVTA